MRIMRGREMIYNGEEREEGEGESVKTEREIGRGGGRE